eukprot:TRINITY_DN60936_c0_g2_i1.p1 TRINITY_DN60936_c0_g2~~TRINITY_DN60936_c0_g2_i1.p1  ORF type:complete len:495 (-),score=56.88 TRINITY_DN60936_c0_g2_i1:96-1580(-)
MLSTRHLVRSAARRFVRQQSAAVNAKPYSEIPFVDAADMPKTPSDMMVSHKFWKQWSDKYGPIFRTPSPFHAIDDAVWVSTPELIDTAFRNGVPSRGVFPVWDAWNVHRATETGTKVGSFNVQGEDWSRRRRPFAQVMLDPKIVAVVGDKFVSVICEEVVSFIRKQANSKGDIDPEALKEMSMRFAFDANLSVLYGTTCGLLSNPDPNADKFMQLVRRWFHGMVAVLSDPEPGVTDSPALKEFLAINDEMHFDIGPKLLEKGKKLMEQSDAPSALRNALEAGLTENEIHMDMVGYMLAAADTTANTTNWLLTNFVKYPEVQQKAYEESMRICGGKVPTAEQVPQLTYLRACLQESFRVTPTAVHGMRPMREDTVFNGYLVPKGQMVLMNFPAAKKDERYFDDPEVFNPDRWSKFSKSENTMANIAANNFSRGPRMCPGARVARMELMMVASTLLQNFKVEGSDDFVPPTAQFAFVMLPSPDPKLRFVPRQHNVN